MKIFETLGKNSSADIYTYSGGLLWKSPTVKKWDKVGVGKSQIEGLGVWALEPIIDDETIEETPVLIFDRKDVSDNLLIDYVFKIDEEKYALALGYGSLYNHRNQPNARWHYDKDRNVIVFRATRSIKPGEEIFISYGKDYFNTREINMKGDLNRTKT